MLLAVCIISLTVYITVFVHATCKVNIASAQVFTSYVVEVGWLQHVYTGGGGELGTHSVEV